MPKIGTPPVHTHQNNGQGGLLWQHGRLLSTGGYIQPWPVVAISTTALVANRLYALAWLIVRPLTIDRLALEVTGAGGAGTKARLGIYANGTNLYPGALLKDVGLVAVDGVAVVAATITGNLSLAAGLYWLALITDGTPTCRYGAPQLSPMGIKATDFSAVLGSWRVAQAYGALPDPFTAAGSNQAECNFVLPRLLSLD